MAAAGPVVLSLPMDGPLRVENSPASRVPSHGTTAFGSAHAIDLVPVGGDGRSAPRTWRTLTTSERPERFVGFGQPVVAPVAGRIALVHDGEPDHEARRSQPSLALYMLGQRRRALLGAPGLAGNHVAIAIGPHGPFVLLAHLQKHSVTVVLGQSVRAGDPVARCGNSGNSTEPHLHLQVSNTLDWPDAHGLPLVFAGAGGSTCLPANGLILAAENRPGPCP